MPIPVGTIAFGEIDAKNEVIEQEKMGQNIFYNGFLIPPGINIDLLINGARCFIYGHKGCGKTSLLLYIRHLLDESGATTRTILFKSGITESERQKIAGTKFTLVEQGDFTAVEYDFKINWLWYIYRNIFRIVRESDVSEGWEIVHSLKKLLGVHGEVLTTALSDLSAKRINLQAKAALKAGPFTAEISAEIEAISQNPETSEIEIIDLVEKYIPRIKFGNGKKCFLLFDELELFWNAGDQRKRDLYLIRDLLYAASRVNHGVGRDNTAISVICSVRSEVLNEVNRVGPEISRDVEDRGVRVNWNVKSKDPTQPILQIIERKINASEIEFDQLPSDDIWTEYFPEKVFGRPVRQYMLDISMFKPRSLVNLLGKVASADPEAYALTEASFKEAQAEFSKRAWTEVEEGLLGQYSPDAVRSIKSILTAFSNRFSVQQMIYRIDKMGKSDVRIKQHFRGGDEIPELIESLYRLGAIGNIFFEDVGGKRQNRNQWVFRDHFEPLFDKNFEVHESLRMELRLPF